MSLLDDVSLMITPNGIAEDVLFGVLPEPIIGAEIITNGDFDNDSDWTKGAGWTISGGKAHRDGSGGVNSSIDQSISVVNGKQYKFSYTRTYASGGGQTNIFVKTNGVDYVTLGQYTSTVVEEHIVTGYFTALFTGSMDWRVFGIGTWTGTFDNISVKEYTSADMDFTRATTATFVNYAELITSSASGFPRLDTPSGGGCPHILVEPQRTNLLDDGNAAASLREVTLTNTTSPDGTANALKLTETTANDQHFATISEATVSSGSVYTMSVFVKKGTQSSVRIYTQSSKINSDITVDLDAGSVAVAGADVVTGSGSISNYGNGWYRVAWGGTCSGSGAMSIYATVKDLTTYTGSTSEYTEYFGGQVELGSYATSYIPTSGSTVTRNAETFTRTGIGDLINSAEGVFFIEMAALSNDSTRRAISLSDGTNTNRVILRYDNASNRVQGFIQVGGATNGNINDNSYTITNFLKIAYKWKAGDFALWINGTEVATSTDATSFGAGVLTEMQFNEGDGAGTEYFGKVRQIQVYKTALSDLQLGALTT